MSNSALVISDLDFASLKGNFITWLQSQQQFKDYNFAGSNLNTLLDIFGYNTFINSFVANMGINEGFLDSAVLRDSIVSKAKELNYTPRSYRSSKAVVTLSFVPVGDPGQIVFPMGSVFNTSSNNIVYTFTTDSDTIITSNNGNYTSANVNIYEGYYVTENYLVDNTISNQRFILSNPQIDTNSLVVKVQNSTTDSTNAIFNRAYSLFGYDETSNIYFVEAASANTYAIVFGDGNIGNAPINGNIISVLYRVCSGDAPNGISTFTSTASTNSTVITVLTNTVANAYGGSVSESNSSIKFYAPRSYETQQRAVTVSDFETLLLTNFPEIDAINVYGGETLSPPQFGKVFIAVNTFGIDGVSEAQAIQYQNFLSTKSTIGITPVVIQPDYLYASVRSTLTYNISRSTYSPYDISSLVTNTIKNFNATYLTNFGVTFRYSKLFSAIDNSDSSILTSDTNITLFKKFIPKLNTHSSYLINFLNPIESGDLPQASYLPGEHAALYSSTFTYNGIAGAFLQDDGVGNVNIVVTNNTNTAYTGYNVIQKIGSVNYITGALQLNDFIISSYDGTEIRVYINSGTDNPTVLGNVILEVASDEIFVTATAIRG